MSSRNVTKRPLCDLTNKFAWPATTLRPATNKSLPEPESPVHSYLRNLAAPDFMKQPTNITTRANLSTEATSLFCRLPLPTLL